MLLRLDMHIHSRRSPDGRMELGTIAARTRTQGLDGAAVCDHDRVLSPEDLREAAEYSGFLLIPGIEISTEYGHLLGWFVTEPIETRAFEAATEAIHRQGGLAVLAHPFERTKNSEEALLDRMEALAPVLPLLDGVEIWNSRANRKNPNANQMAEELASLAELPGFAGSDAHLSREIGNGVTALESSERTLPAVRAALLSGKVQANGRQSLSWDTARSQWTRLRKIGAGPLSCCKWAAFAVKCLSQDILGGHWPL